ncbi:MAG: MFS transporter [Bacteroidales bacterium]|nr:MFS transporter [Bacteroidales bacterium]
MKKFTIPYKWELVLLLWFAFFFNQADRQIFNVVLPSIRDDLGLTDADMGLIASILNLFYGLMVPFGGIIGDRFNKKFVIIISLLVWSIATLTTGLSYTILQLIFLRSIALGGGEAFYAPSANALICEHHQNTRSTALSIHQTALYVGVICSGYLTGYVADLFGWRVSFYVFGGFGILIAIVLNFRLKDSVVIEKSDVASEPPKSVLEVLKVFFTKPTALLLTLAFAGMQFAGVGFLTWTPTFLHEKFNFSLARAGFDSTFYLNVAAFIGVMIGARIADKLAQKVVGIRAIVQMIGLLIGIPFIIIIGKSNSLFFLYSALAFFGLSRGMFDSNIFAALYDVIEIPYRSTATGIMLMFAFVVGSASPYVLGILKPIFGLSNGLAFLSIGFIFAVICILIALIFFYKKDKV